MAALKAPLPRPDFKHIETDDATRAGKPTQAFALWLAAAHALLSGLANGSNIGPLTNAANDAAAAAAGVPINGLYRNGNAVQIRLT